MKRRGGGKKEVWLLEGGRREVICNRACGGSKVRKRAVPCIRGEVDGYRGKVRAKISCR